MVFDRLFDAAGAAVGLHGSHIALLATFIVSYPLGSIFVRIPKNQPALKHAFNISVALFFLLGLLHLWTGTLHFVGSAVLTYILAATVKGRTMPWTVFGLLMSHLLVSHWIRYKWPTGVVEISGAQMVLTMKLSTFAWNVYDGRQKLETLDESQKETRIEFMPSLLAYFGYIFYFPAFLVGPALTYTDYMALVDETAYGKGVNSQPTEGPKRVPSGRKRVAYQKLALGAMTMGVYAVYGSTFGYEVTLSDWWMTKPFWDRVLYTQICGIVQRTKYYGAWYLTEGACIFSGYGFNGYTKDGKPLWNKAANIDVINIEWCPNFKILLDSWNIHTNTWLRNSVYKRLVKPGGKPTGLTTLSTFMTSAIWHGVYPGYYLTFFIGSLISSAAREARRYVRPFFLPPVTSSQSSKFAPPSPIKRAYDTVGTLTTLLLVNYIVAPFMLLDLRHSIQAWNTLYWYGHVSVALWLLWGNVLGGFAWLNKLVKRRASLGQANDVAAKTPKGELIAPPLEAVVPGLRTNGVTNGKAM